MKRIKMMLLSLALFAVVGGALAFKARFQTQYCTAPVVAGACDENCPALTSSTTQGAVNFFCTTTPFNGSCSDAHDQPLPCFTSTKLKID